MRHFALISVAVTTIMMISGFVYFSLASFNWGAGEIIMHVHLWLGLFFTLYLCCAVPLHIRNNRSKIKNLNFSRYSYVFGGVFSIVLLTGITHFVPYISYFFSPIYYQFETYEWVSFVHMVSAVMLAGFFVLHLTLNFKERS